MVREELATLAGLEGQAGCTEAQLGGGGGRATLVRAREGEAMCQRRGFPANPSLHTPHASWLCRGKERLL